MRRLPVSMLLGVLVCSSCWDRPQDSDDPVPTPEVTQTPPTPSAAPASATPTPQPITPPWTTPTETPWSTTPPMDTSTPAPDEDGDGSPRGVDCDDTDSSVYPGATELCDGKDDDCDREVDEGLILMWYYDQDRDSYGTDDDTLSQCQQSNHYVGQGGDCDDTDSSVYPGATELCGDGIDADCSGKDMDCSEADVDGDGYCAGQECADGSEPGDCDGTDAATYPGALEQCNGKDDDCNGEIDDQVIGYTFYLDSDGDGYGDPDLAQAAVACVCPAGYAASSEDCDDGDPLVKPGATEIPGDEVDQNCDSREVCYEDADNDGYRPSTNATIDSADTSCEAPYEATISDPTTDCNDSDGNIHPGHLEVLNNVDDDCDGMVDEGVADFDGDGYSVGNGDCDDSDPSISPAASERCNNVDDDCDGEKDEGLTNLCVVGVEFLLIPHGSFTMGSPSSEVGRRGDEIQHTVTLSHDFYVGRTEVTQAQFQSLMGYNPSSFPGCGGTCPVEEVTWYESAAFTNALSSAAGLGLCYTCTGSGTSVSCAPNTAYSTIYACPGYRLLTESEWEYAARAGTTPAYYNGGNLASGQETSCSSSIGLSNGANLEEIAWFCGISAHSTHTVGGLQANPWGLFDMSGNVWEFCNDWYAGYPTGSASDPTGASSGSFRVLRGGSWYNSPQSVRSAQRGSYSPGDRYESIGFRAAKSAF